VRRNDLYLPAGLSDAMQLIYETEDVGNMLDHMPANYFFKLIVVEWIRKHSEIVNHICMTQTIRIDSDRAGKLILTTTDIKNHELVLVQQQCA